MWLGNDVKYGVIQNSVSRFQGRIFQVKIRLFLFHKHVSAKASLPNYRASKFQDFSSFFLIALSVFDIKFKFEILILIFESTADGLIEGGLFI